MLHSQNRTNHPNASRDVTPSVRVVIYGSDGNSDTYITNTKPTIPAKLFDSVAQGFIEIGDVSDGDGNSALTNYRPGRVELEGEGVNGSGTIGPDVVYPGYRAQSRHTPANLQACLKKAADKKNNPNGAGSYGSNTPEGGYRFIPTYDQDGKITGEIDQGDSFPPFTKGEDICGCFGLFQEYGCYHMTFGVSGDWELSPGHADQFPINLTPSNYGDVSEYLTECSRQKYTLPVPLPQVKDCIDIKISPEDLDLAECLAKHHPDPNALSKCTEFYKAEGELLRQLTEYDYTTTPISLKPRYTEIELEEILQADIKRCMVRQGWEYGGGVTNTDGSLGGTGVWIRPDIDIATEDANFAKCVLAKEEEFDRDQRNNNRCIAAKEDFVKDCQECYRLFGPLPVVPATNETQ